MKKGILVGLGAVAVLGVIYAYNRSDAKAKANKDKKITIGYNESKINPEYRKFLGI
jgi:hypothetical protein